MRVRVIAGLIVLLCLVSVVTLASAEGAVIKFVNNSSTYLRFYVDGVPSGACNPGDYAVTTASLGRHTLKAVGSNGGEVERIINLGSDDYVWTVHD